MQNPWPETVPVIHCQRGQKVGSFASFRKSPVLYSSACARLERIRKRAKRPQPAVHFQVSTGHE